jgi:hypothetical protein
VFDWLGRGGGTFRKMYYSGSSSTVRAYSA